MGSVTGSDGESDRATIRLRAVEGEEIHIVGDAHAVLDLRGGNGLRADSVVRQLVERFGRREKWQEVESVGRLLMREGNGEWAVAVCELNTRVFPEAWNTWDSLGEAHFNLGHTDEAFSAYQRSLELNPENIAAERMIERVRSVQGR